MTDFLSDITRSQDAFLQALSEHFDDIYVLFRQGNSWIELPTDCFKAFQRVIQITYIFF